ncbi:GatB/YqeY domain-containing protein [Campylobacter hepaticus]|uniref:GatB/YqeY domain-containing protein n=1 Tax=Campylobacter hepaticus TaxID=1813019 RepID=A0A424Z161_9BACT|nr:GatB/YqeY domain-containing protein [Campylobacter hepaticus]AXP08823.1 GatB/YqeY domain-containing protein [Campylobacter hepaticus]MCZ0772675.1 GatB/YqeY domain-containing protein [Campylobacter hepaticus]MCZ0774143.1 GatB/YqeY domain-containing protein [Campylobacter hepaticus]MCZ0775395.1 GatB/YqeY domain-containing protein [Campylobacter hepaticus]MDX2323108.1 GatB/YqeY domain-containing protein [Campylobacter hepaticus]
MTLKEQILNDIKEAMKQKDDFKRDSLRNLNAAFKQVEVDERIELDNERIYKIIASEIKKRQDAKELYLKANRDDLAQKEEREITLFKIYLPRQLSDEELNVFLKEIIAQLGVESLKDQGLVMKEAKAKLGSSVEGRRLNLMLRELLQ